MQGLRSHPAGLAELTSAFEHILGSPELVGSEKPWEHHWTLSESVFLADRQVDTRALLLGFLEGLAR